MDTGKNFINEAYRALFQKDYHRAIEWFKKAITVDQSNANYYYILSVTYARNNNLNEAHEAIQKAVELKPDSLLFQQHYEMIKARMIGLQAFELVEHGGNEWEAISKLELAVRLDPLDNRARLLLSWLLIKNGKWREARKLLNEILALDPSNHEAKELLDMYK